MPTVIQMPSQDSPVINGALQEKLIERLGGIPDDPWGHMWVHDGVSVVLVPWDDEALFTAGPIIFVDETRHEPSSTFALGCLLVDRIEAVSLGMGYVDALLRIREAHPTFWPADALPPRLHLVKVSWEAARAKTPWRHLSSQDMRRLLDLVLAGIRSLKVKPWIFSVSESDMRRALDRGGVVLHADAEPDLRVQAVALQFQLAAELSLNPGNTCEMIVDYDETRIGIPPSRRQATLRFRDVLMGGDVGLTIRRKVLWDPTARFSSKFPPGFTWQTFSQQGHAFRPLINSVGLQLIDVYLGLWRQLSLDGQSPLGIRPEDLGGFQTPRMTWNS